MIPRLRNNTPKYGKLLQNILIIPVVVISCYIKQPELNIAFLSLSLILILNIK